MTRWHGHKVGPRMAEVAFYVHSHLDHAIRPREIAAVVGHGDVRAGYRIFRRAEAAGLVHVIPDRHHRGWGFVQLGEGRREVVGGAR